MLYRRPMEDPPQMARVDSCASDIADEMARIASNSSVGLGSGAAIEAAECPICFEALCAAQVCVFTAGGRRSCRHFFHLSCAQRLQDHAPVCPMCRCGFDEVVALPDPEQDVTRWFNLVDRDGSGCLKREEVRDVFAATLDVDQSSLDQVIAARWDEWDSDQTGGITEDQLSRVLAFVQRALPGRRRREPPALTTDKGGWFDHFDERLRGTLNKQQMARALIKTLTSAVGTANHEEVRNNAGHSPPTPNHRKCGTIWRVYGRCSQMDRRASPERPSALRVGLVTPSLPTSPPRRHRSASERAAIWPMNSMDRCLVAPAMDAGRCMSTGVIGLGAILQRGAEGRKMEARGIWGRSSWTTRTLAVSWSPGTSAPPNSTLGPSWLT